MEPDFSGYATKAGLKCSDGRIIMRDAFKHQDKMRVPLVWQHGWKDPENVLGHAILENRDDGVYAYAFFNQTEKANHAKQLVVHGDIINLSIWANELLERSKRVIHGTIREVSLVLSGANPGATIENISIRHSVDGVEEDYLLEDEAIIHTNEVIELTHADEDVDNDDADDADNSDGETILDVYNSMNEKQKNVLHFMVGEALAEAEDDSDDDEDSDNNSPDNPKLNHSNTGEKDTQMGIKHKNVFENQDGSDPAYTLTHDDMAAIFSSAEKTGSLSNAVEQFALAHGIENIGTLFPEAANITDTPEFLSRRADWVNSVLGGARKSPFSRVRSIWANLTYEQARAKGYVTGNLKREEYFPVAKRETTPTTIYKKQELDRDDMIDITDFDVVAWLRAEMRVMLDEELARAILVGDGRDPASADKINEGNIRPIATDHDLYATKINVNLDDALSSIQEVIDAIVANRGLYRGTGNPTLYTTESVIAKFLLLKDTLGRRIYTSLTEVASELRVDAIVPVEVLEEYPDIVGIMVNMADYNIGADKGGNVSMFDDFDIDYNKQKYLLETRCSGALIKLKSALVIKRQPGSNALVVPNKPSFVKSTGVLTITTQTGVKYYDITDPDNKVELTAGGGPYTIPAGESMLVSAEPQAGKYFEVNSTTEWMFTTNPA